MPFIVMKRGDIPAATLQVLDLEPNTSQRNLIYDPPPQSKYVNPVVDQLAATSVVGAQIVVPFDLRGLAAWFLTNTNDGSGAAATGGDVAIGVGNAADGDTVEIDTSSIGGPTITYTYRTVPSMPNDVAVGGNNLISADTLAGVIFADFAGFLENIASAAGTVTFDAVPEGTAGDLITVTVVGAALTGTDPAGGLDAVAITAADANANAAAVLGLLNFGDLTMAAGALDVATVNAALVGGAAVDVDSLILLLCVLAGQEYTVPTGVVIQDTGVFEVSPPIGTPGGPFYSPKRPTFDTDSLILSFNTGELAGFTAPTFEYQGIGGAQGEAVVVYNDDGTLFV